MIRNRALGGWRFRRQHMFDSAIVDFYCPEVKVAIEVDGGVHLDQVEYDVRRDRLLERGGIAVIRFWNTEIHRELPAVLNCIDEVCRQRATR